MENLENKDNLKSNKKKATIKRFNSLDNSWESCKLNQTQMNKEVNYKEEKIKKY